MLKLQRLGRRFLKVLKSVAGRVVDPLAMIYVFIITPLVGLFAGWLAGHLFGNHLLIAGVLGAGALFFAIRYWQKRSAHRSFIYVFLEVPELSAAVASLAIAIGIVLNQPFPAPLRILV